MLNVLIETLHLDEKQSKGRRVLRENQLHIFMPILLHLEKENPGKFLLEMVQEGTGNGKTRFST